MEGKKIILAVTGSIAAYKAAYLTRLLSKEGCDVQVLMTRAAKEFVTPVTFSTLSNKPVYSDVIALDQWNSHVELGLWADAMVVAPATANTIARCAAGMSDNMVVATYLSARCPVFIAPAMDLDMWQHKATQDNVRRIKENGVHVIPVGHGELASGLVGEGRMAEPEEIVDMLRRYFAQSNELSGKRALVTAGPTHEHIDPVRFIGNPSTGKMGIAVAEELHRRGAYVDLILGPTHLQPNGGVHVTRVQTAHEMFKSSRAHFGTADITVFAAAVGDYKPAVISDKKIKKAEGPIQLDLERTEDIAQELSKQKSNAQITVGFALETDRAMEKAKSKLKEKGFDLIVLNSLEDEGAGFGLDTNKVKFIYANEDIQAFELKSKREVARDIADAIVKLMNKS